MRRLSTDERGASMVEYALLVVLIAIIALMAVQLIGDSVEPEAAQMPEKFVVEEAKTVADVPPGEEVYITPDAIGVRGDNASVFVCASAVVDGDEDDILFVYDNDDVTLVIPGDRGFMWSPGEYECRGERIPVTEIIYS